MADEILDEEQPEFADFDAAFAELPEPQLTGMPYRLYGRDRRIASRAELGAMFALQVERIKESRDPRDVQAMVGRVFGRDALADFLANGMTDEEFEILLLWGTRNALAPGSMSLAEAVAEYRAKNEAKGKAKQPPAKSPAAGKKPRRRPSSSARS